MIAVASIQDLLSAFAALTDSDLLALRKSASLSMRGTEYTEPADLIHEALARCLTGARSWPTHVPLTIFLANIMRSIANSDRRTKAALTTRAASQFGDDSGEDFLADFAGFAPSAEDVYIQSIQLRQAERALENLRSRFAEDRLASIVLAGWLSGRGGSEILEDSKMRLCDYDAARKRLQREALRSQLAGGAHGAFF